MTTSFTDEELTSAIKASPEAQEKAMEYLYTSSDIRRMAFTKIHGLIDDRELADAIFVDGLMSLRDNILFNKFEGKSTISTFLVRICYNKSVDHLRKSKGDSVKQQKYQEEIKNLSSEGEEPEVFVSPTQDTRYAANLKSRIYKQLSAKCRTILQQKFWDGLKMKEIAKKEIINEQSAKNRLSDCKKKLRMLIETDAEVMELIKNNYGKF